jgi:hypothetical protein
MGAVKALLTLLKDYEKHDIMIGFAEEVDQLLMNNDQSKYEEALKIIEKMNQIYLPLSIFLQKKDDGSFILQIWRLESTACFSY